MDDTTGRVTAPERSDAAEPDLRTDEIREEIAQTRVELAETIEAIQQRLTPSHLVAHAGETVRNATTEKVKQMANTAGRAADQVMNNSVVETIKSNPIPAAMVGIGAAWLLIKGRSDASRYGRQHEYSRYRATGAFGSGDDWRRGSTTEGSVGTSGANEYGSGFVAGPGSREYGYQSDARAAEYGSAFGGGSTEGTSEFGGEMRGYGRDYPAGRRQPSQLERIVRDNPIALGAAAALVGVAIGMSAPATEAENRLMGDARDTVVDKARDLAADAADKVQDVAGQAVDAATQVRDTAARTANATGSSTGVTTRKSRS